MNKFSTDYLLKIHELSAYLVPGVVFLYGFFFLYPHSNNLFVTNVTIGNLVVILLLSYAVGHIIQSIGNVFEKFIEYLCGDLKQIREAELRINLSALYKKALKDSENNNLKLFKSHGKIRLGLATSLSVILIFGWIGKVLTINNFYQTFILSLLIFSLLRYMRKAESKEISEALAYKKK